MSFLIKTLVSVLSISAIAATAVGGVFLTKNISSKEKEEFSENDCIEELKKTDVSRETKDACEMLIYRNKRATEGKYLDEPTRDYFEFGFPYTLPYIDAYLAANTKRKDLSHLTEKLRSMVVDTLEIGDPVKPHPNIQKGYDDMNLIKDEILNNLYNQPYVCIGNDPQDGKKRKKDPYENSKWNRYHYYEEYIRDVYESYHRDKMQQLTAALYGEFSDFCFHISDISYNDDIKTHIELRELGLIDR